MLIMPRQSRACPKAFTIFFYASFDPAGVVSVDKPPLGLWVQTVFVLIFGYHGWVMILPQALSAAGACILMYALTAKYFGRVSGLVAALVFALTPAVVVAARNNTMDMQLILVLEAAVWFLFKSIESSKWRYLFVCAVFVGLGFNIKMLQAYMILPAIVIVYLIFARGKLLKRLAAGGISLVIMAAVSFAWVVAVDLTPASDRPVCGQLHEQHGVRAHHRTQWHGTARGPGAAACAVSLGGTFDGGNLGGFTPDGNDGGQNGTGFNRPDGQRTRVFRGVNRPDGQGQGFPGANRPEGQNQGFPGANRPDGQNPGHSRCRKRAAGTRVRLRRTEYG